MDEIDREILKIAQDNFPLAQRPFLEIAKKAGIAEAEVIERVKKMFAQGIVRRINMSVRHRKLGITANAMTAWKVPADKIDKVGGKMASFEEVTHCYERKTVPGKWEYNVFTVVHDYSKENAEKTIKKIADAVRVKDYKILYSVKEYKKTYKRYG